MGLSGVRTPILALAMGLPLAPSAQFDEGLRLLAVLADAIAEEHGAILQFMRYLRTQWSPLAEAVSVHGCPARTNNLVESFHNEARRKLGGLHPNVWKFIGTLYFVFVFVFIFQYWSRERTLAISVSVKLYSSVSFLDD